MPSLVEEGSPHCTTVPSTSDLVCVSIEVVLGNKQSMLCVTVWFHSYFLHVVRGGSQNRWGLGTYESCDDGNNLIP